jgi:hypothetical protein
MYQRFKIFSIKKHLDNKGQKQIDNNRYWVEIHEKDRKSALEGLQKEQTWTTDQFFIDWNFGPQKEVNPVYHVDTMHRDTLYKLKVKYKQTGTINYGR